MCPRFVHFFFSFIQFSLKSCIALESHSISDISCGQFHSMVLTHNQDVYSFGRNNFGLFYIFSLFFFFVELNLIFFGQIGVEREVESVVKPRLLKQLIGQNIIQVCYSKKNN